MIIQVHVNGQLATEGTKGDNRKYTQYINTYKTS